MKIHSLHSLLFISTLALACAIDAENSCQDVVYLGSELILDETAGQKVVPLQAMIKRITELAPAEELSPALTSLAKQLADGTAVVPKDLALDAIFDARDLLVRHNDQIASDDELRSLDSQLEFYQTAIENGILTADAPQAEKNTAVTRSPTSLANVALYVTGSADAMAITLGDIDTANSVDLISKSATGTTTVDGGTVNIGTATATTVAIGKTDNTATNTLYGTNELPTGLITKSGSTYIHATGIHNFFAGVSAGNRAVAATDNTTIGYLAGAQISQGGFNTAVGSSALTSESNGNYSVAVGFNTLRYQTAYPSTDMGNTAVGFQAGYDIRAGTHNTLIGFSAGSGYTGSESNNICIGNMGRQDKSDKIHIGATQTACYVAGVDAASAAATAVKVIGVDTAGQLVTSTTNPVGFTLSNPLTTSGIINANSGVDAASALNLGTGSATTINMGRAGGATVININGGDPLRFTNPSDPTKYVGFKGGSASGTTIWTLPTADGASGTVLQTNGSASLSWQTAPTPASAWLTTGNLLGGTEVFGSRNAQPVNFVTDSTIRMSIAGTDPYAITATSQIIANGGIDLPSGLITASTAPYIHKTGGGNFFAGTNAGNLSATLTANNVGIGEGALYAIGSSAVRNTAVGRSALQGGAPMSGVDNTAVGYNAGLAMHSGNTNTLIGSSAGVRLQDGNRNVCIGVDSGYNYVNQNDNICIGYGVSGTTGDAGVIHLGLPGTHTSCYVAGVNAASAAATAAKIVGVDTASQLVTSTSDAGGFTLDDTLRMSAGRYAPAVPYGSAVTPMIQYGRVDGVSANVTNNSNGVAPNATPHPSTGVYVIDYTTYGANTPVIFATPEYNATYKCFAVTIPGTSSCTVYIYDDGGTPRDVSFNLYITGVPA